jgi:DGQHR domain-containing protein
VPTYPAIYTRQRDNPGAPLFATFVAPVGEIMQWASIERISPQGGGAQRLRNEAKVHALSRFLELELRNTIPTAIIVALNVPDFRDPQLGTCSSISIDAPSAEDQARPGKVIDGQHRLYGMSSFDPTLPVNVVALVNPSEEETAFQFVVINNKATKVSSDHLRLLALNIPEDDEQLKQRLKTARISFGRNTSLVGVVDGSEDSPFYHSINWPIEEADQVGRAQLVLPAAVELALAVIGQRKLPDLADDDTLLEFFFAIWRSAKTLWPELWVPESKLLGKVGLVALTTFIVDDILPLADRQYISLTDPAEVEIEVTKTLANIAPGFWTTEWAAKGLDTSAGRQLVVDSLVQTRRNLVRGRPWNLDVALVRSSQEEQ